MRQGNARACRSRARGRAIACLAVALGSASPVLANTATVFSPDVAAGDRSFSWRGAWTAADGALPSIYTQRLHYQHALNGQWRLRLVAAQRSLGGGALDYRGSRVEALWQYREHETHGWDAALRLDVEAGDEGPDFVRLGWAVQRALGERWGVRANVFVGHELGGAGSDGVRVATRVAVAWTPADAWRIALESYNDYNSTARPGGFDDQRHQLGPLASVRLGGGLRLHAGFLVGLSSSADDLNWRLALDYAF